MKPVKKAEQDDKMVRPRAVTLEPTRVLVEWSDGHRSVFANKGLREACPCALCQGEPNPFGGPGARVSAPVASPDVKALSFAMVGLYAVTFVWSDSHQTGIYPYDLLLSLCECDRCRSK
jgi:DUF971 family protein